MLKYRVILVTKEGNPSKYEVRKGEKFLIFFTYWFSIGIFNTEKEANAWIVNYRVPRDRPEYRYLLKEYHY